MMLRALALILLATPALAQDDAAVAAMTAAIEEAGCIVTADNGDAVPAASGLSDDEVMAVIAGMYADGLVDLQPDGTMKLTNAACP